MGKASRRKRETNRAERTRKIDAPALSIMIDSLGKDGAELRWETASGFVHRRRFARYQDAQSFGYALLRGDRR